MENTIKSNIKPFKIYDHIYFVGSRRVSVHIIETEKGLLMFDTGCPDMYDQILDSMNELGLKPENICAIFHTHGHIDHFGCTQKFQALSGAKTYISRIDNDIVNGKLDLSWAKELSYDRLPYFDCDVLIEDGDVFSFGNISIRCVLSPGHTDGAISYFITIKEKGKEIVAGLHGGSGFNTLTTNFLKAYNLPFDCRDRFIKSLNLLADEHVDIMLGNHPEQSNTEGKLNKVLAGEGVIDADEWRKFMIHTANNFKEKVANGL